MINGEYKKKLLDMFQVLGFTESEKKKSLENFEKKIAFELFESLKGELPADIDTASISDPSDPRVAQIQQAILEKHSLDDLAQRVAPIFHNTVNSYISFMSQKLDPAIADQLRQVADS